MKLKTPVLVGILLLVLGVAAVAYEGVTSYAHRDAVVDGAVPATAAHDAAMPLSPVLGLAAMAAGAVLVKIGTRKRPLF